LLADITKKSRSWILTHPEELLSSNQLNDLEAAMEKLERGDPLPYVVGHWEFYGLSFNLTRDVLIPRPETEILVEEALIWLQNHPDHRRALDVGTGSGCIALTLLTRVPNLTAIATDISNNALKVAQTNSRAHGVEDRINFINTNLLSSLAEDQPFDIICGNLPYIPTDTLYTLKVFDHEPFIALSGGTDGLEKIRGLLEDAPRILSKEGLLLLEIESTQGLPVTQMARDAFPGSNIRIIQDLSGNDRVLRIDNSIMPNNHDRIKNETVHEN
jgi:release factor glutamine methyltransferase